MRDDASGPDDDRGRGRDSDTDTDTDAGVGADRPTRGRLGRAVAGVRDRIVPRRDGDLASRSVRSGLWVGLTRIGDRLLALVSLFVLARLLGPAEFGLIGVALLVLSALSAVSRLGLLDALVQRPEADVDGYLDTAFWLMAARGVIIAGIVWVTAPLVAAGFDQPVTDLLRALAVAPLIHGLRSPAVAYIRKEFEGHHGFLLSGSAALARDVVAIALALATGSVWALVAGQVTESVVRTAVSYVLTDYRPSLSFDRAAAADLVGFGKWVTAYALVNYLVKQGDDLVVGWLLGATALGLYRITYRVGTLPVFEVTDVVGEATFPAYASLQADPEAVKTAFLRTFRATTAVTLPAAVGVALVAPAFVPAVLGPAWLDAVPLLRAIGVYAAVVALTRLFVPVWTALGRPDYTVRTALVRLAVLAATIVPAVRTFGVLGAILAVGGSFLVAELPLRTYVLRRVAGVTVRELAREVAYPAVATLGMAAVVLQVTGAAWPSPAVELVVAVAVGAATYGALALALDRLGWGIGGTAAALARAVSAPPR